MIAATNKILADKSRLVGSDLTGLSAQIWLYRAVDSIPAPDFITGAYLLSIFFCL